MNKNVYSFKRAVLLFLSLSIVSFALFYLNLDFRRVVPASFAMEFCSCYYVEGQSKENCEWYATQIIAVDSYVIEENEKLIRAYGLHKEALARYQGKRFGCVLLPKISSSGLSAP